MFGSFGAFFLCGAVTVMTFCNMPQLYRLLQLEDYEPDVAGIVRGFLDIQFPGRRARRIAGRYGLVSWLSHWPDITPLDFFFFFTCSDTLKTLFIGTLWLYLMKWSTELLLWSKELHPQINGEHLQINWIPLLTSYEKSACWSCLRFYSIGYGGIWTFFLFTRSHFVSSFIILFPVGKYRSWNRDNNSKSTMFYCKKCSCVASLIR